MIAITAIIYSFQRVNRCGLDETLLILTLWGYSEN